MVSQGFETQRLNGRRGLPSVRRDSILRILDANGSATIGELATELSVSPVTIHRDLELLEGRGALQRVQGGATAVPPTPVAVGFHTKWTQRLGERTLEKAAIAVAAERHIDSGSTVFLDGSTTCLAVAAALEATGKSVTVVTDSPAIAYGGNQATMKVIMAPGLVDAELRIVTGEWTTEFLSGLNFNVGFISGAGVDIGNGVSTTRREIVGMSRIVLSRSAKKYCLADSSKFDKSAFLPIESLDVFDAIISDSGLDNQKVAEYTGAGATLERARSMAVDPDSLAALIGTSLWSLTFGSVGTLPQP